MFEGFQVTKQERELIDRAWRGITENTNDEWRSVEFMKQETRGYGRSNDRIPPIAAKGLCLKWFLEGFRKPDMPLRDRYYARPAAIWFEGMGCAYGHSKGSVSLVLQNAVKAYEAAFKRMYDKDMRAIAS